MDYTLYTLEQRPDLEAALSNLHAAAWPPFMLEDATAAKYWHYLYTTFRTYQLVLCNTHDVPIAAGHSIPLFWDHTREGLPQGWDAALTQGVVAFQQNQAPNCLCALAAIITPALQGQGLSSAIITSMRNTAAQHQLPDLIAPVRPSKKSHYPLMQMEEYSSWMRADGLPFDPWLRVHTRLGATILQVAPESMRVEGTIAEWEQWSQIPFHTSGLYTIPNALVPITIDREQDRGTYIEPNVWMHHRLNAAI